MKKIFRYKFLLAAIVLGTMVSCAEEDDVTEDTRADKPLVSVDATSFTLTEGESFTLNFTATRPLSTAMDFKLELIDGNGSFRDYVVEGANETGVGDGAGIIGNTFSIPAYATTYSVTITPEIDLEVEGTETFVFALTSAVNARGLVAAGSERITATVADYVSNDVGVKLIWDQNYADSFGTIHEGVFLSTNATGGTVESAYTTYDFDLYVFDAATSTEVTEFAGATGNSPEMLTLSADLPDGDYLLVADLFDSGDVPNVPFTHQLKMQVSKFGHWTTTIDVEGYTDTHPNSYPDGLIGGETIVATLTKTGTTYVLKNPAGDTLASGRFAALANQIKAKKSRK